jgi:ubiquinone/menaquinone biosynthesis C-methylase UbiE
VPIEIDEVTRIKRAYKERDRAGKGNLYSLFNKGALFMSHRREEEILAILSRFNMTNLGDKKILDLGCGSGMVLRDFLKYGAEPDNCFGIDLLPQAIEKAKRLSPNMHFLCENAEQLSFENEFFDLVITFTVFSSILDAKMKKNIAKEMVRVLKTNGIILWFDYHMDNPWNNDVKGIKKKEIRRLFSGCSIYLHRIILAPPITRRIAPYSWVICYLLESLRILNTHYLGAILKNRPLRSFQ